MLPEEDRAARLGRHQHSGRPRLQVYYPHGVTCGFTNTNFPQAGILGFSTPVSHLVDVLSRSTSTPQLSGKASGTPTSHLVDTLGFSMPTHTSAILVLKYTNLAARR